jgi:hypothetical protein
MRAIMISAAVLLAGCNTTKPPPDAATVPPPPEESGAPVTNASYDLGVRAFQDVCIATAPSFVDAPTAAKAFGLSGLKAGEDGVAMSKDQKISVQLKPGTECAVSTQGRPGDTVGNQFLRAIVAATGTKGKELPLLGKIGGSSFIFQHDRTGGEAYAMVKR